MEEKHYDLDVLYKQYMKDISKWLPDGIIEVNLDLLSKYHLLHFHDVGINDSSLTRYFHVIESDDKLVLVNSEFVIWIVPENSPEESATFTLIALNKNGEIKPEIALSLRGYITLLSRFALAGAVFIRNSQH